MQQKILQNPMKSHEIPNETNIFFTRGFEALNKKQYEDAVELFSKSIENRAYINSADYYNRSIAYKNLGKLEEALEDAECSFENYPSQADQEKLSHISYNLGTLYEKKNLPVKATKYLGLAMWLNSSYGETIVIHLTKKTGKLKSVISWMAFYIVVLCLLSIFSG